MGEYNYDTYAPIHAWTVLRYLAPWKTMKAHGGRSGSQHCSYEKSTFSLGIHAMVWADLDPGISDVHWNLQAAQDSHSLSQAPAAYQTVQLKKLSLSLCLFWANAEAKWFFIKNRGLCHSQLAKAKTSHLLQSFKPRAKINSLPCKSANLTHQTPTSNFESWWHLNFDCSISSLRTPGPHL